VSLSIRVSFRKLTIRRRSFLGGHRLGCLFEFEWYRFQLPRTGLFYFRDLRHFRTAEQFFRLVQREIAMTEEYAAAEQGEQLRHAGDFALHAPRAEGDQRFVAVLRESLRRIGVCMPLTDLRCEYFVTPNFAPVDPFRQLRKLVNYLFAVVLGLGNQVQRCAIHSCIVRDNRN
jgi:hypothetical protein